ncbi:MAG: sodium:proton antiporter NhaD [Bacteroidales bacterium]|nr:sodium:proton antiporter NhaD [Bacteroidales bacterium]
MFYLMIVIFVIGYLCIALEHPLKINKTAFALLTGVLIWTVYILTGPGIFESSGFGAGYEAFKTAHPDSVHPFIDFITTHELIEHLGDIAEILFYLMGAMTVVELIDTYGGFNIITDNIKTTNKVKLLWILSFITFFFSAILDNLTTAIVMVALLRKLLPDKHDRWFFGGMVILAANAGGAWSPIGDVTTIMLWIAGRVSTGAVMLHCLIPSLVSMIIPLIVVSFVERGEIDASKRPKQETNTCIPTWQRNLIFFMGVAALVFVPIFKILTHLKPYMGIMLGLSILWIVTEILHKTSQDEKRRFTIAGVLTRIDLPSILFFLGILLAVSGLQSAGHLSMLASSLDNIFHGNFYLIDSVIGILSSIIDNVPLVAGAMGMYTFPMDHLFWVFLAYCAGTGGSLLIIGSAAGVAVMGMEKIDFIWYLKHITPYALLGYLAGIGCYILIDKLFIAMGISATHAVSAMAAMPMGF